MAQKKPKTYTPKFKFQLVLEVLQGERSEVEIGRIYGVHHTTISKWKKQFLAYGAEVFSGNEEVKHYEKRIADLERMIGQKEIELALLKKLHGRELRVEEKMELVEEHRGAYGLNQSLRALGLF